MGSDILRLGTIFWTTAMLLAGCARSLPPVDAGSIASMTGDSGLAFGRFHWEGPSSALGDGRPGELSIECRHVTTGHRVTSEVVSGEDFVWILPAGRYEITEILSFSGGVRARSGALHFAMVAGAATYVGTIEARLGGEGGTVEVFDDSKRARPGVEALLARRNLTRLQGLSYSLPRDAVRARFVDAVLDDRIVAPLYVDPSQEDIILTRTQATALDLFDASAQFLPAVRVPRQRTVGRLKTLRVGDAMATDVEVVIDEFGELAFGILGGSFLRRVDVGIDREGEGLPIDRQP